MLAGKTVHPLELPGISENYKDSTVHLIRSLSERSHQFLHGFKKTTLFVSGMYISNT